MPFDWLRALISMAQPNASHPGGPTAKPPRTAGAIRIRVRAALHSAHVASRTNCQRAPSRAERALCPARVSRLRRSSSTGPKAPGSGTSTGSSYIDFAGGLGCHNTGHGLPAAVAAIHEQVDRYLHQCFIVGMYEPYVDVCRRLAELSPCRGADQKTLLVNSGAEALENAVKIARVYTGRPAVVVFEHAFHGRTLLTMTMTSKLVYKKGIGPFAPGGLPRDGALPVPRRRHRGGDPRPRDALQERRRSRVRRLRRARAGTGRGRLHRDAGGLSRSATGAVRPLRDPLRRRRGAVGHRPHRPGVRDRALRRRARPDDDRQVDRGRAASGRRHRARGGHGRRASRRPRGHLRRQPGVVRGRGGGARHRVEPTSSGLVRRSSADGSAARLDEIAGRVDTVGEVRGLGSMLALELVEDREHEGAGERLSTRATVAAARERGLVLLSCGLYSNVIRILVPDRDRRTRICPRVSTSSRSRSGARIRAEAQGRASGLPG